MNNQKGFGWSEYDKEKFYNKIMNMNKNDMNEFEEFIYNNINNQKDNKNNLIKIDLAILDWNISHTFI